MVILIEFWIIMLRVVYRSTVVRSFRTSCIFLIMIMSHQTACTSTGMLSYRTVTRILRVSNYTMISVLPISTPFHIQTGSPYTRTYIRSGVSQEYHTVRWSTVYVLLWFCSVSCLPTCPTPALHQPPLVLCSRGVAPLRHATAWVFV